MKMNTFNKTALQALLLTCLTGTASLAVAETREWNFSVFLDDKKVGYHRFSLSPADTPAQRRLESRADFDVTFLFFTAYSYEHRNTELWNDGCLQRIDARTNANGKVSEVDGQRRNRDEFYLEAGSGGKVLPGCVRSFAYWDPQLLQTSNNLLNPQTGEYLDVQLEQVGREKVSASGRNVEAVKYRIRGEQGVDIAVWYTPENDWLALESTLESGRVLSYRLEQE